MFKINIRSFFSIIISKTIIGISSRLFKGGTNFPGRVALKIDKNILSTVTKNYSIVFVTGTNGKTTTTNLIYNILKSSGKEVITNNTGANLKPGITSCFIKNFKFNNQKEKYAIIEIDEANLKFLTEYTKPKAIIITNLFRDQLDRYGEVYTTLLKIMEGVKKVPETTLILNGDESLLGNLDVPNKTVYYGFDCPINENNKISINADAKFCNKCKHPYEYEFITYNHLGKFFCNNCGYKRPTLNYYIDKVKSLDPSGSSISINGTDFYLNQPGVYNIYNALCAYSVAKFLNVDDTTIFDSLKNSKSSFGRQEAIDINGKSVKIILVKNPAGYDEAIKTISLDTRKLNLAVLLNDNYADGRDVSWIWDVDFENLNQLNINKVMVSGIRLYDMAVRLKIAGLNNDNFEMENNFEELLSSMENCTGEIIYVLATYTAMIDFRKFLYSKGFIKKLW
ncbi:Mur ligase family protein [Clostridium felsineum]|uniref:Mur ligase family protein n=1 Tax=Clostridium felsineum TaxID=36839 RepID=UPI0009D2D755|nr:Mur ligase family protein [Clostridium felsineum]URZ01402.1 Lipid II isoglutaminyl synthase (glutamine-hydrolyzing) subunit MurT [Clostridium felsineum]